MRTRLLPIFFGVVFALTLFFAVAAGAQVQLQEVQQQQVPDNQQQILEVQQQQQVQNHQGRAVAVQQQQVLASQQGLIFAEGQQADGVQAAAADSGALRGTKVETRSTDNDRRVEVIIVPLENDCKFTKRKVSFVLEDDDGTQADFIQGDNIKVASNGQELKLTSNDPNPPGPDDPDIVPLNERGGDKQLDTGGLTVATSTGITCEDDNRNNDDNNNNNDNNNDNDGNTNNDTDNTDTTETTTTQDTTDTTDTTTTDTTSDALETTTANNPDSVREADAFRCDFFLRAVRDDRGALRAQYQGDELIVQRFEQCLSEDVLADTIPDRRLPFTGGPLLPFGGGLLLVVAAAVLAGRIIRR